MNIRIFWIIAISLTAIACAQRETRYYEKVTMTEFEQELIKSGVLEFISHDGIEYGCDDDTVVQLFKDGTFTLIHYGDKVNSYTGIYRLNNNTLIAKSDSRIFEFGLTKCGYLMFLMPDKGDVYRQTNRGIRNVLTNR